MRRIGTYSLTVGSATEGLSRAGRVLGGVLAKVSDGAAGAARRAVAAGGRPVPDLLDGSVEPGPRCVPPAVECRAVPLSGVEAQVADADMMSVSVGAVQGIVQEIFGVGLKLAACAKTVEGPAAERLAAAIGDLDGVVAHLRLAAFEHAVAPPVASGTPPGAGPDERVGGMVSALESVGREVALLARSATEQGMDAAHLISTSYSINQAIVTLEAYRLPDVPPGADAGEGPGANGPSSIYV